MGNEKDSEVRHNNREKKGYKKDTKNRYKKWIQKKDIKKDTKLNRRWWTARVRRKFVENAYVTCFDENTGNQIHAHSRFLVYRAGDLIVEKERY